MLLGSGGRVSRPTTSMMQPRRTYGLGARVIASRIARSVSGLATDVVRHWRSGAPPEGPPRTPAESVTGAARRARGHGRSVGRGVDLIGRAHEIPAVAGAAGDWATMIQSHLTCESSAGVQPTTARAILLRCEVASLAQPRMVAIALCQVTVSPSVVRRTHKVCA